MARTVTASGSRTNRKFLIVAVLFGTLTAVLFYAMTSNRSSSSTSAPAAGDQQVVVAKLPIKQRTTVTADMLELQNVPLNAVVAGAYTTIADAVGKVTKFPIEAKQQVVAAGVVDTARPLGGAALAEVVPTGRRAMSIQASQVLSAGGLVLPGDFVDIVWAWPKDASVFSKTILRNVQVAAVAQTIVSSGPVASGTATAAGAGQAPVAAEASKPAPDAVTLTLLLTPEESQLIFLAEQNGTIRADLRGVGDQETADSGLIKINQIVPIDLLRDLPEPVKPPLLKTQ